MRNLPATFAWCRTLPHWRSRSSSWTLVHKAHRLLIRRAFFALRPEARSRINTVYMVTYFTGAAISIMNSAKSTTGCWNGAQSARVPPSI